MAEGRAGSAAPSPWSPAGAGTPGRGRSHPRAAPLSVSRCPVPLLTTLLPVLLGAAMTGHVTPRAFSVPDPEKIVDSVTPATRPVLFPANAGNCWLSLSGGVIYARPFLASQKQKKTNNNDNHTAAQRVCESCDLGCHRGLCVVNSFPKVPRVSRTPSEAAKKMCS